MCVERVCCINGIFEFLSFKHSQAGIAPFWIAVIDGALGTHTLGPKRRLANKSSNGNGSLRARMLVELEEPGLLANPGWFMPL